MQWWDGREHRMRERVREAGFDPDSPVHARSSSRWPSELLGFPRHLSQHVGGFVISRGPLDELVPIENAAMDDRTVIQWDKDDLDDARPAQGRLLALGMLTAIRSALRPGANDHRGRERWTLGDDPGRRPARSTR